jgi:hypothetical protein
VQALISPPKKESKESQKATSFVEEIQKEIKDQQQKGQE